MRRLALIGAFALAFILALIGASLFFSFALLDAALWMRSLGRERHGIFVDVGEHFALLVALVSLIAWLLDRLVPRRGDPLLHGPSRHGRGQGRRPLIAGRPIARGD